MDGVTHGDSLVASGSLSNRPDPGYYILTPEGTFLAPSDRLAFETADDACDALRNEDCIVVEVIA